jgi:hypothetical protein
MTQILSWGTFSDNEKFGKELAYNQVSTYLVAVAGVLRPM